METLETLLARKAALDGVISRIDVWLLVFGILVVVGVAGESVFGIRAWWNNRKLHSVQQSIDELRQKDNLLLQSELLKLRKESEPRRLTGEQKDKLVRLLDGTHCAVVIVSKLLDTESADFADDLSTALHDGVHWETLRVRNRISSRYGVSLGTVSGTIFPPEATRLDKALTTIGISHDKPTFTDGDATIDPPFQPGFLYLVIEQKPLPSTK